MVFDEIYPDGKPTIVMVVNPLMKYAKIIIKFIKIIVTVFWKTNLVVTNTEIHFCLYTKVTLMHHLEIPSI